MRARVSASVLVAWCASAAVAAAAPPRAPSSVVSSAAAAAPAHAPVARPVYQPVEFGKIVAELPTGTPWLTIEAGPFCIARGGDSAAGGREGVAIPGARGIFQREITRAGLKSNVSDDLFGPSTASDADFVISGLIHFMNETVCFPSVYSTEQSGQISMTVDWRLYSKSRGQVVATVQTSVNETVDARPRGGEVLLENAFAEAVDHMAAAPAIRKALAVAAAPAQDARQPVAQPPIGLAGSLATVSHGLDSEADSVVLITAPDGGFGSGFLVSKDGYLLTDAHVVGDAKTVKIRWSDGKEAEAQVVRVAKVRDVAVIWSDPRGRSPLPLRKDMPQLGDTVFAIGAPLERSFQGTVMRGIVSAHRVVDGFDMLQSDVNANHGMSGGPLLDDKGRVVALVESAYQIHENVPEGINYFTPVGDALRFLSLTPQ